MSVIGHESVASILPCSTRLIRENSSGTVEKYTKNYRNQFARFTAKNLILGSFTNCPMPCSSFCSIYEITIFTCFFGSFLILSVSLLKLILVCSASDLAVVELLWPLLLVISLLLFCSKNDKKKVFVDDFLEVFVYVTISQNIRGNECNRKSGQPV